MKIVIINSGFRGSTGTIMLNVANLARKQGHTVYTFSAPKSESAPQGHYYFGNKFENMLHRIQSVSTGISGIGSKHGTAKLLKMLDEIKPDIINLHNLHGWYINIPMLFNYLKEKNIKTIWTLHDCWSFTAQCSHFIYEKCNKWKTGCFSCPRYRLYPYTYVDRTAKMYHLKKEWLLGVNNMTIVTPSKWLAALLSCSYLKDYPVRVIHNGIDLAKFQPVSGAIRTKYQCENKKILLGVASGWGMRKGLDVFIELAKRLPNEEYKVILIGVDEKISKTLPSDIISIRKTHNQEELAQFYSVADLFINPTREDNYPTVNMEALACGTPVITFRTGGSPESIDQSCGIVIENEDIDSLVYAIKNTNISSTECRNKALKCFKQETMLKDYLSLYSKEI